MKYLTAAVIILMLGFGACSIPADTVIAKQQKDDKSGLSGTYVDPTNQYMTIVFSGNNFILSLEESCFIETGTYVISGNKVTLTAPPVAPSDLDEGHNGWIAVWTIVNSKTLRSSNDLLWRKR